MKKTQIALLATTVSVLISGCGVSSPLSNNSEKAQKYISEACMDGDPVQSWQARTNLAARAYALDKTWKKFYESTSSLAAIEEISKNQSRWDNAPGNDGVQIAYINAKSYSIYAAECYKVIIKE